jgi:hypothetical protein
VGSATLNRSKLSVSSDRLENGWPGAPSDEGARHEGIVAAMDRESKGSRASSDQAKLERAIVLQLLRDDHERMWSHAQLAIELEAELEYDPPEIGRQALEKALRRLERDGVLGMSEHQAWASSAARRLDELELIGV